MISLPKLIHVFDFTSRYFISIVPFYVLLHLLTPLANLLIYTLFEIEAMYL